MQEDVEVGRLDAAVREVGGLHVLKVDVVGQAVIIRCLAVVVSGDTTCRRGIEGIDMDADEDVGFGCIGNVAAGLQFFDSAVIRRIDVDVGRTGHDDIGTGSTQ